MRCAHRLVVDERLDDRPFYPGYEVLVRRCLTCGISYDRTAITAELRNLIRVRYRLPRSPWSAEERTEDTE